MTLPEQPIRLNEIVNRMLDREPKGNALAMSINPFDTTPQNQHRSKPEFMAEKTRVVAAIENIEGLFDSLLPSKEGVQEDTKACNLIRDSVNASGRQSGAKREVSDHQDLIIGNALEHGLHYHTLILSIEMKQALLDRLKELEDQENSFWSASHRPPNHYARTIALRLARLYAREKQERPTYGTSRDGGHPSTAYTKALEEVFELLEIQASVTPPARWAVSQITEEDLKPTALGTALGLGGFGGFNAALSGKGLGSILNPNPQG
jgi:hypothetical protein